MRAQGDQLQKPYDDALHSTSATMPAVEDVDMDWSRFRALLNEYQSLLAIIRKQFEQRVEAALTDIDADLRRLLGEIDILAPVTAKDLGLGQTESVAVREFRSLMIAQTSEFRRNVARLYEELATLQMAQMGDLREIRVAMGIGRGAPLEPAALIENPLRQEVEAAQEVLALALPPAPDPAVQTSVADLYRQYLDQVAEAAKNAAQDVLHRAGARLENLESPGAVQVRNELIEFKRGVVNPRMAEYRDALENSDLEGALSIGKELLSLISALDTEFARLAQRMKLAGTNAKVSGFRGDLTKKEQEIRQGKGRNPGIENIVAEAEKMGSDLVEGVRQTVEEFRQVGQEAGAAFEEGMRDALDTHSPSRQMQRLAKDVAAGLVDLVDYAKDIGHDVGSGLHDSAANAMDDMRDMWDGSKDRIGAMRNDLVGAFDSLLSRDFGSVNEHLKSFHENLDVVSVKMPVLGKLANLVRGLAKNWIALAGLTIAVQGFIALGNATFDATTALEDFTRQFDAVSGSADLGAANLEFATDTARKLGLELNSTREAYAELVASTRFTPLEGFNTQAIFDSFAETASLRGLSNDQQSRMFTALGQVAAKGEFKSEEVRQQLGDIGALNFQSVLARSLGVDVRQLNQMMEQGQVSSQSMAQVAAFYKADNARLAGASQTTGAAINKLNAEMETLKATAGQPFLEPTKQGIQLLGNAVQMITPLVTPLYNAVRALIALFAGRLLISAINSLNVQINVMSAGLSKGTVSLAAFGKGIIATTGKVALAAGKIALHFGLAYAMVETWTNVMHLAKDPFPELENGVDRLAAGLGDLRLAFETATEAGQDFSSQKFKADLPQSASELQLNEGINVFGRQVNLDPVRQWLKGEWLPEFMQKPYEDTSGNLQTRAEQKRDALLVGLGDLQDTLSATLNEGPKVRSSLQEIHDIEQQINQVRFERSQLPLGDTNYDNLFAQERQLLQDADTYRDEVAAYQTQLEQQIAVAKQGLETFDAGLAGKELLAGDLDRRNLLVKDIDTLETELKDFQSAVSALPKAINIAALAISRLSLASEGTIGVIDNNIQNTQINLKRRAFEEGWSDDMLQLNLDRIEVDRVEATMDTYQEELNRLGTMLQQREFAVPLDQLRQSQAALGFDLYNNDALIEEMLGQEGGLAADQRQSLEILQRFRTVQQSVNDAHEGFVDATVAYQEALSATRLKVEEQIDLASASSLDLSLIHI